MVIKTVLQLESGQFDIEIAFLYGKFEEDLWMVISDGYQDYVKEMFNENIDSKTHCLKITRAIYGLVQAAKQ
jgi:phage-related holin